jgi:hypothetical protein
VVEGPVKNLSNRAGVKFSRQIVFHNKFNSNEAANSHPLFTRGDQT